MTTDSTAIAPTLTDGQVAVMDWLIANDAPWEVLGGPNGSLIVAFERGYTAEVTDNGEAITVALVKNGRRTGETTIGHKAPAQGFLVAAHVAALGTAVEAK